MIKLKDKEYQFEYTFSKLDLLMEKTGVDLTTLNNVVKTFKHIPTILSIGSGMSEEEARKILDSGTFDEVSTVIKAFTDEVTKYFPNQVSQAQ